MTVPGEAGGLSAVPESRVKKGKSLCGPSQCCFRTLARLVVCGPVTAWPRNQFDAGSTSMRLKKKSSPQFATATGRLTPDDNFRPSDQGIPEMPHH
jgi:hypothetical protein